MVVVGGRRQAPADTTPSQPDYSAVLRSDIWKLLMTLGVIFAVVVSMVVVLRNNAGGGAGATLALNLSELKIEPSVLKADAAAPISIEVHNRGTITHNLSVIGHGSTEMLAPGQEATLKLGSLPAGVYELACEVPGHKEGGMKGQLIVGGASGQLGSETMGPARRSA